MGTSDNYLFRAWPRIGVLVNQLRRLFDVELETRLEDPVYSSESGKGERTGESPVVEAMLKLLEKDGRLY